MVVFLFFFSFRMFLWKLVRYYFPSYYESCFGTCFRQQILYSSKRSSFALDSTCAYCYWPGTGGCYFPIVKLQDETNMADSHNKTDLVRSITHHHSLSYNCIFRGVGVVFFSTPRITQSHFPLNTSFPRRLS